jgi:hypothetical protein
VDERRSADRAPGPEDSAAAMVMANSTRAWDQSYDLQFQRRGAQEAVDSMQIWRQHMLARGAGSLRGGQGVAVDAGLVEGSMVPLVLAPQEEEGIVVLLD